MKTSAKRAQLKNNAKILLEGKYYATIMALIFYNMLTFFLTNFSSSLSLQITSTLKRLLNLSQSGTFLTILSYFVIFLFTALCNVFRIGICLFFLNIACNQYYSTFDLFHGFYEQFGKSFRLTLVITGLTTLAFSPVDAFIYLFKQTNSIRADVLGFLVLLQLLLLILYIPLSLALSQSYYILLDYPDLTIGEILKHSIKLMNGQKLPFFYLQLSFLPLLLLTTPTFGLGALWLTPYLNMTNTLFYLDMMQKQNQTC